MYKSLMHEDGKVKKRDFDEMKERIKVEMPEWIATMKRYDDPSITDMEEVWGLQDFDIKNTISITYDIDFDFDILSELSKFTGKSESLL